MNSPIPVTVTATDANGVPVTSYTGPATLTYPGGTINLGSTTGTPTTIPIGSGVNETTYPLTTADEMARFQTIYLASDMGDFNGTLSSLSLDVAALPGQALNNFTVRMQQTAMSSFAGEEDWVNNGNWTTVYSGTLTVSATGWLSIPFTTTFSYNGTSNLMVDISFDNTSKSSNGEVYETPVAGTIRSLAAKNNGADGAPTTWTAAIPAPTACNYILNAKFTGTTGTTSAWNNGSWTGTVTITNTSTPPGDQVSIVDNTDPLWTGISNYFTVCQAGALDHFAFDTINSPQNAGVAFPVTVTAEDANNFPINTYAGPLFLSELPGTTPTFPGTQMPTVTIGAGNDSAQLPLTPFQQLLRMQTIYQAGDINVPAGGNITSLSLYLKDASYSYILNNFTVRLQSSPSIPADYSLEHNWLSTGWTTVYQQDLNISQATYQSDGDLNAGWITIPFTTPFPYDGTDNLMVDFSFVIPATSYDNMIDLFYYEEGDNTLGVIRTTAESAPRGVVFESDEEGVSELGTPTSWANLTNNAGVNWIPNVIFNQETVAPTALSYTAGTWTNGVWTGKATIASSAASVTLLASDDATPTAHTGTSNSFVVDGAAAKPVFSLQSACYPAGAQLYISDATPGALIYYTTDGSVPSYSYNASTTTVTSNGTLYTGPITLLASANYQAKAFIVDAPSGFSASADAQASYIITCPPPTFTPTPAVSYTGQQTITIADAISPLNIAYSPAVIYYTLNGQMPTTSSPIYYTAPQYNGAVITTTVQGPISATGAGYATVVVTTSALAESPRTYSVAVTDNESSIQVATAIVPR